MIQIHKLEKPEILKKNELKWTSDYLNELKSGITTSTNKYNHEEIKQKLIKETHGKCAYCESKMNHISFADIEHILPKSKRPELYVEWSNLTISCEVCNRIYKKDYYNPQDPIINPVADDPKEYLQFFGALVYSVPGKRKGELTKEILHLNRTELIEKRQETLKTFTDLVNKYASETNPVYKSILKEEILRHISPNSEYSLMLSNYLKYVNIF